MSERIWLSRMGGPHFGIDGLRQKFPGQDWQEPYTRHEVPLLPKDLRKTFRRYIIGEYVPREELVEASAVYDPKYFAGAHTILFTGLGYIVDEPLANLLRQFDLGPGGLSPHPIYEADERTPIAANWFLLGLGAQKQTFLPEQSRNFDEIAPPDNGKPGKYMATVAAADDTYAFSAAASEGSDIWCDPTLRYCVLFSDALGSALMDAGYGGVFRLMTARVL